MKLIDLVELLFRPAPVQFEPCPWHGPVLETTALAETFFPTTEPGYPLAGHHFHYRGGGYEWVGRARVIAVPDGTCPIRNWRGEIVGFHTTGRGTL